MTHAIQDIEQVSRWTVLRDSHLHVCTGQVWLTRDGELADHVLGPGQGLDLHHGDRVTAEPWHSACCGRGGLAGGRLARCRLGRTRFGRRLAGPGAQRRRHGQPRPGPHLRR